MIILGEKINTSRRNSAEAVEKRDTNYITRIAREQAGVGVHHIDVNAGTFVENEAEHLPVDTNIGIAARGAISRTTKDFPRGELRNNEE